MRGVLQVKQAPECSRELRAVWRSGPEKFFGSVVVVATVQAAEAGAADRVGCGDSGQDCYAGGDIEVLTTVTLPEHSLGHFQVCLSSPEPRPRLGPAAR
jgi:hypothetical protein